MTDPGFPDCLPPARSVSNTGGDAVLLRQPAQLLRLGYLALGIGILCQGIWPLERFFPSPVSPSHSYVSELAARDLSFGWFFARADTVAGLLLSLGAGMLLVLTRATRPPRLQVLVWWALALWGLATLVDSLLRLPCVATTRPGCEAQASRWWEFQAHSISSSIAGFAVMAAIACFSWGATSPGFRRSGLVVLLLNVVSAGTAAWFEIGGSNLALGAWQRAALTANTVLLLWYVGSQGEFLRPGQTRANR